MRVLLLLAGLLLCVYSAPLQQTKLHSRAKRAAEQVIFGNHQNNARVKKSGPGLATPLQPLKTSAVKEDEEDIDKKALVTSKVTSSEQDPEGLEDLSDDLETDTEGQEDTVENEAAPAPEDASSQAVEEQKDEETVEAPEDTAEENMEEMWNEDENLPSEVQPSSSSSSSSSFPVDLFEKNHLGNEYMDYPTYDYQFNPYLRRKRSLSQSKTKAVVAEDMMQGGPSALASPGRRSKRDLGQDVRYLWDDVDYPEVDRRGYEEPDLDEDRQAELQEMLKEEILKYNPEMAEEVDKEIEEEEGPYGSEQEAEDLALINYLYRNGYGDQALEEEYAEEEEAPEPWEEMGPAPQVSLPVEDVPYFNPYSQYTPEENVMSAPYSLSKRQYLSLVPGNRKRSNDFYPYAYGADGRWGAMVNEEVMEKRAEERMYERLLRLASALRDRRDELEAERYYAADDFPEK